MVLSLSFPSILSLPLIDLYLLFCSYVEENQLEKAHLESREIQGREVDGYVIPCCEGDRHSGEMPKR